MIAPEPRHAQNVHYAEYGGIRRAEGPVTGTDRTGAALPLAPGAVPEVPRSEDPVSRLDACLSAKI